MQASLVPYEQANAAWPLVEKYMVAAAEYTYGRYTAEDIRVSLLDGQRQLWVALQDGVIYGAVVTQIMEYPQMRVLVMHFLGGVEGLTWKAPMLALLQRFARDHNCRTIESTGRSGWARIFRDDGAQTRGVFFELPVEPTA